MNNDSGSHHFKPIPIMTNYRSKHEDEFPKIMYELLSAKELLNTVMHDPLLVPAIQRAADIMIESLRAGGKIIACGNGGSMSDAMHFAAELTGRLKQSREPIAAVAISDPAHITCVANDFGFDQIFSRYIKSVGRQGDVLLVITTSGNSENIVQVCLSAAEAGIRTIALTGNNGGRLLHKLEIGRSDYDQDHTIVVPGIHSSGSVQQIHIKIIHILCMLIENDLTPTK